MPTLYLLCGAPGCGKSTWAKQMAQNAIHVSRDKIRFNLLNDNDDYFDKENEVFRIFVQTIQAGLSNNNNMIADATHLNLASRQKLLSKLNLENVKVIAVYFRVPLKTCLCRNEMRNGRVKVPEDVVMKFWNLLTYPNLEVETNINECIIINEEGEVIE